MTCIYFTNKNRMLFLEVTWNVINEGPVDSLKEYNRVKRTQFSIGFIFCFLSPTRDIGLAVSVRPSGFSVHSSDFPSSTIAG